MKKLLTTSKMVALAAGVVSIAQIASAGTVVNYAYQGESASATGPFTGGVTIGISTTDANNHTVTENALVGQFVMTTSNPNFSSTLLTYCTDIGSQLATGSSGYNYTPTALSSASSVAPGWITGGITKAAQLWFNDKGAATTAVQTAGLQLAIWELLYNNVSSTFTAANFGSGNGGFHITSADTGTVGMAEAYAQTVLDNFANGKNATGAALAAAVNVEVLEPSDANGNRTGGSQGLLYQTSGTTSLTAPDVTSTLPLFGAMIMALGVAGRKLTGKA